MLRELTTALRVFLPRDGSAHTLQSKRFGAFKRIGLFLHRTPGLLMLLRIVENFTFSAFHGLPESPGPAQVLRFILESSYCQGHGPFDEDVATKL